MSHFHRPTQNFLLGKNQPTLASADFKLAVLTSQLSLLTILVCLVYLVIDLQNDVYNSWHFQTIGVTLSFLSFILNRQGFYYWAKIMLMIAGNLTIFSFALVEPIEIGVCFLFVICYLVELVVFGFEHRRTALAMITITSLLLIFSSVIDLHIMPRRIYTPEYIQINFAANLIITSITSILVVYFLLMLNFYSENSLRENEKDINQKNDELTKVNKELDRFVYSTSHDLRSPISSIRGLINLSHFSTDANELKSYLKMMESRLIHLNKFINDISDYSRNSRLPLNLTEVNLKKIVLETFENLKFYPGAEKIKFDVHIAEGLTLKSDAIRVQVLLGNLISNAFKYADHKKNNSFIKIDAVKNSGQVVISIEDNGIGIQPEYLTKIFDMFFQGHEKSDGSGLGLYIVKETLEKIKGTITVESEPGRGSLFTVVLSNIEEEIMPSSPKEISSDQ